jgi:hypothetical protein
MRYAPPRTVITPVSPPRASARGAEYPWASAAPSIRLAAPRSSRRAMRRTDFCLLTSSYEHPRLAGSRCVNRFRACAVGEIACFTAVRFASVGRTFSLDGHRSGLVVPAAMRACRTSDIPVASSPCADPLARSNTRESRRDRLQLTRVNGASRADDPGCLPSCKDPSPRDALSSARLRTSPGSRFGHRMPGSRRLFTPGCPCEHPGAGLPSTCPVANGSHASSSLGAACRLLQPEYDARAHPSSCRPSHASGAFAPLLAGTNRCRLRWPPRCVAAPGACEPRPVHTDLRAACSACADETSRGPKRSSKGERALLDDVARALLVALRAPGSPARSVAEVGGPP